MKIIVLIIAICYLLWTTYVRNLRVNDSLGIKGNFGNFLGTLLNACTEGVAWYFIFKYLM